MAMFMIMRMVMMVTRRAMMTLISHRTGPVKSRDANCLHKMQEHLIIIKIIVILLFSSKIFTMVIILIIFAIIAILLIIIIVIIIESSSSSSSSQDLQLNELCEEP